jgi:hypothetical protein
MMKTTRPRHPSAAALLLALACACAPAAASPLFEPEPPEPAAAGLLHGYLSLLSLGRYEQAIYLNDMRGMREHLLQRRIAELKTNNPQLTAGDLEEMSAQIQLGDLHPSRLRAILLQLFEEAGYEGMTWRVRGYAPAPGGAPGLLASVDARMPDGEIKPVLIGLVKLGNEWMVSPAIVEQMMASAPPVRVAPGTPPPPAVSALIDAFWTRFQAGELDQVHADMAAAYRDRVPLLAFLGQAQKFIDAVGLPTDWNVVQGVGPDPHTLFFGVAVSGSKANRPTLMKFQKTGQTWTIEDIQFEIPKTPKAPGAPPPGARPDLRPDLAPSLRPDATIAPPVGKLPDVVPPTGATPVRTRPDAAPLGPVP